MSKKALALYGTLFSLGVLAGSISYLNYLGGSRSVEASIPGTNAGAAHLIIAVVLAGVVALINRSIRTDRARGNERGLISGDGGFWRAPFTERGGKQLVFSLLALPTGILEFLCGLAGAVAAARRLERWRLSRFLDIRVPATTQDRAPARRYFLIALPVGLVLTLSAGLAVFTVWRAGLQVIGALDPNFCINGWGGPSYLGASSAHWMDAGALFFVSVAVVRLGTAWQGNLAVRLLDGAHPAPAREAPHPSA
ncbi:MAG: hypothetical protein ABI647_12065 [Gemmatimonadota bacterium]